MTSVVVHVIYITAFVALYITRSIMRSKAKPSRSRQDMSASGQTRK